jgi:hypothetical protein
MDGSSRPTADALRRVACPLCGRPYECRPEGDRPARAVRHAISQHMSVRHPHLGLRERSLLLDAVTGGV